METHVGYQDPLLFVRLRNSLGHRLRLRTYGPPILGLMSLLQPQIICQYKAFPRDRYRTNQ